MVERECGQSCYGPLSVRSVHGHVIDSNRHLSAQTISRRNTYRAKPSKFCPSNVSQPVNFLEGLGSLLSRSRRVTLSDVSYTGQPSPP